MSSACQNFAYCGADFGSTIALDHGFPSFFLATLFPTLFLHVYAALHNRENKNEFLQKTYCFVYSL